MSEACRKGTTGKSRRRSPKTSARVEDAFKVYGGNSRAIMQVQKEQMQAALAAFAKQHVDDLRCGWRNVWREKKVLHPFELADGDLVTLEVRIDRVDYNDRTKQWRIIDYKSHAHQPHTTHWGSLCTDEAKPRFADLLPDWTFELHHTSKDKKEHNSYHHWKELQLPLYAEALKTLCESNHAEYSWPEMGYYNVPRGQAVATYSRLTSPGTGTTAATGCRSPRSTRHAPSSAPKAPSA